MGTFRHVRTYFLTKFIIQTLFPPVILAPLSFESPIQELKKYSACSRHLQKGGNLSAGRVACIRYIMESSRTNEFFTSFGKAVGDRFYPVAVVNPLKMDMTNNYLVLRLQKTAKKVREENHSHQYITLRRKSRKALAVAELFNLVLNHMVNRLPLAKHCTEVTAFLSTLRIFTCIILASRTMSSNLPGSTSLCNWHRSTVGCCSTTPKD